MVNKTHNSFEPAWWLPNGHLQTLWPVLTTPQVRLVAKRERLELPDGDFLDLDWVGEGHGPLVLLLHGLGGTINSPYARRILSAIQQQKWRAVFMHFRGSGVPNRLPRFYHSGETGDLNYVINELKRRESSTPLAAIGYSLGGNVLVKWLAENSHQNPLQAAVAVCVPFELEKAALQLNKGASRFYQWWLLRELRQKIKLKFQFIKCPIDLSSLDRVKTFWDFDNKITAPLHGFIDAADYYKKASTRHLLKQIHVPTLILQSNDDPFMSPDVNPQSHELSNKISLEIHEAGGHVGFVAGKYPWDTVYWLDQRILEYLSLWMV